MSPGHGSRLIGESSGFKKKGLFAHAKSQHKPNVLYSVFGVVDDIGRTLLRVLTWTLCMRSPQEPRFQFLEGFGLRLGRFQLFGRGALEAEALAL